MDDESTRRPTFPEPPYEQLRLAVGDDPHATAAIDDLENHLASDAPNHAETERHVGRLRGISRLEATIANWWESPEVQRFFSNLSNTGL